MSLEQDTAQADVASSTLSRLSLRITPFLFLLYTVAYVDRINVSFAAPQMRQLLGFSDAVYGLGAGIFFAGYLVFQLPSTLALERVGAKRWIAALLMLWGMVSAATALVRTPMQFYGARFLLGAAEAGFFPGVILYLKKWFPDAMQARTVAWFMTAGPIAGLIAGPISGPLLNLHFHDVNGWQWLFLAEGVPAIILGAVVLLYLTEAPEDAAWLRPEQRQWLLATLESRRHKVSSIVRSRTSVLIDGAVWCLVAVYFGLNVASYGITLWLPTAVKELGGLNNVWTGIVSAIPYGAAVVAMVWLGRHSDRTGERRWHVAAPGVAGGLCLIAASGSRSSVALVVAMSVAFVVGVSSRVGAFWALANGVFERKTATVAVPFINAMGNAGGFFGPYILGLARTSSATASFGGGLFALGAILAVTSLLAPAVRSRAETPS